ncbi:MAG: M48 family metallopeptidase [Acholeplasmatales bacterium]|nr:M48 family metallopeptidase [Acholeplasmatales bacterium]
MLKKEFIYNYQDNPIHVYFYIRRGMTKITIALDHNEIKVNSPRDYTKEVIIKFINKSMGDLINKSDDYFTLWGQRLNLQFGVADKFSYLVDRDNGLVSIWGKIKKNSDYDKYLNLLLKDQVEKYIAYNQDTYQEVLNSKGIDFITPIIDNCKTRRGCYYINTQKLKISSHMALHNPKYLDLVIYHEHAHIKYFNHRQDFHELLESLIFNHRQLQKELNKQKNSFSLKKWYT